MSAPSLPRPVGRQREVLYLPPTGHTVVLGTAGSGKTTLAILRSIYLSDPKTVHGGKTLLVTFNRCLVTYMTHLAGTLLHDISVENYHRFARGYLSYRRKLPKNSICGPNERSRFTNGALLQAREDGLEGSILERPTKFFEEEFQWIQQHGINEKKDYVAAERVGRTATRVARRDRSLLFKVYKRYLEQRRIGGKQYDWDDLASTVLSELHADDGERRYRHVVIDEGQDFSPEMLRSLAAAIPNHGSLMFFGDIAQQIYGHRVSWRSAGLRSRDIWRFKENYRNTKQISQLALALADTPFFPDDPDLVEPTAPVADGPAPALRRFPDETAEWEFVLKQAGGLAKTGTVAILFRTREQERHISGATRLHRRLGRWPSGPGLFFGTYHAAKGLEFDTVFLPFLSSKSWPHPEDVSLLGQDEASRRNARLLYVGITRARSTLVLTNSGQTTSLLPQKEGLYQ